MGDVDSWLGYPRQSRGFEVLGKESKEFQCSVTLRLLFRVAWSIWALSVPDTEN